MLVDRKNSDLSNTDLLFHYTSVQVALENILFEGKLRFAPYSSTHDPLEFSGYYHVAHGTAEEPAKIISQIPAFERELGKAKIACFCQTNDVSDRFSWGVSRSRMWSQHASAHFGVCLAFSKEKLLAAISKTRVENESFFHKAVDYDNKPTHLQGDFRILRTQHPDPVEHVRQVAPDYFFSKREDYRDENEYRIVLYDPSFSLADPEDIDCIDALEAIILGCRTPACYTGCFLNVKVPHPIDILKINWNSTDTVLFDREL